MSKTLGPRASHPKQVAFLRPSVRPFSEARTAALRKSRWEKSLCRS
ncbi:MAG: hypothetical protein [Podoviridae sp. ctviO18]|nr:MAG: hypothetical protein [Podoviridae sp. ctviO18]